MVVSRELRRNWSQGDQYPQHDFNYADQRQYDALRAFFVEGR
jgi:hypothetical protein